MVILIMLMTVTLWRHVISQPLQQAIGKTHKPANEKIAVNAHFCVTLVRRRQSSGMGWSTDQHERLFIAISTYKNDQENVDQAIEDTRNSRGVHVICTDFVCRIIPHSMDWVTMIPLTLNGSRRVPTVPMEDIAE